MPSLGFASVGFASSCRLPPVAVHSVAVSPQDSAPSLELPEHKQRPAMLVWLGDERLHLFYASASPTRPPGELWRFTLLDTPEEENLSMRQRRREGQQVGGGVGGRMLRRP